MAKKKAKPHVPLRKQKKNKNAGGGQGKRLSSSIKAENRRRAVGELLIEDETLSLRELVVALNEKGHKCTRGTVGRDVSIVLDEWANNRTTQVDALRVKMVKRELWVIREAEQAWELSKKPRKIRTTRTVNPRRVRVPGSEANGNGGGHEENGNGSTPALPGSVRYSQTTTRTEESIPSAKFLMVMLKADERLARLVGAEAPKRVVVTVEEHQEFIGRCVPLVMQWFRRLGASSQQVRQFVEEFKGLANPAKLREPPKMIEATAERVDDEPAGKP